MRISALLLDQSGTRRGSESIDLAPKSQTAKFLDEIFSIGPDFTGSVHLQSGNAPFAAVGLRQRSSGVLAALGGATAAFPAGMVGLWSDRPGIAAIGAHENGEKLAVLAQKDATGTVTALTGVVWTGPNGEKVTVQLGNDGLPHTAVIGDTIAVFANWTETAVDVAIIPPNGQTTIARSIPTDLVKTLREVTGTEFATLQGLKFYSITPAFLGSKKPWTLGKILTAGSVIFSGIGCVASLGALPASIVGAVYACSSALTSGYAFYLDMWGDGDTSGIGGIGLAMSVLGCATSKRPDILLSCADTAVSVLATVVDWGEEALSAKQAAINDATQQLAGGSSGGTLVAWYAFEDASKLGKDSAGGYDGTPVNVTTTQTGKVGRAAVFGGGYILLPQATAFDFSASDFTLSVFFKSTDRSIANWFTKADQWDHHYGLGSSGGKASFFFNGGGGGSADCQTDIFDGAWHHVAGVRRGNVAEIWVDGKREGQATITSIRPDAGRFALGRDGECCGQFNGTMDEAKIWSRALSAAEIQAEAAR